MRIVSVLKKKKKEIYKNFIESIKYRYFDLMKTIEKFLERNVYKIKARELQWVVFLEKRGEYNIYSSPNIWFLMDDDQKK